MGLLSFRDWMDQQESSSATRARHAAALGLLPMATIGSPHGRSTASPFEVGQIDKALKNKKKKKKKSKKSVCEAKNGKKVTPINKEVDKWLQGVGALKSDVDSLKDFLKKKEAEPKKKEEPEKPEEDKTNGNLVDKNKVNGKDEGDDKDAAKDDAKKIPQKPNDQTDKNAPEMSDEKTKQR